MHRESNALTNTIEIRSLYQT